MANRTRNLAVVAVAMTVLVIPTLSAAAEVIGLDQFGRVPHVRSSNRELVALIQQAAERSATFRGLIETINGSDSIVFVDKGHCGHGVRACFVNITFSGRTRYMFVRVDTHKADVDLMGSIAHELRHTIEVIGEPTIRSYAAKFFFYEKTGARSDSGSHETRAAMDAGDTVRAEAREFNRQMHPSGATASVSGAPSHSRRGTKR